MHRHLCSVQRWTERCHMARMHETNAASLGNSDDAIPVHCQPQRVLKASSGAVTIHRGWLAAAVTGNGRDVVLQLPWSGGSV